MSAAPSDSGPLSVGAVPPVREVPPVGEVPSVGDLLGQIAEIGRDRVGGGYRRLTLTPDDAELGAWFAEACAVRGLDVTTDRCGNQWAWWGDPDAAVAAGRPGVVTGSHLDSVPNGGAYDGPLGVAAALVAVDLLRARGFTPRRPVGVVRFLDEEGARFGLACSGSRLLTGAVAPETVLALQDDDGITYAEAVVRAGRAPAEIGADPQAVRRIGRFIEVHVEQGRALATDELASALGVGSAIRPHGRWRLDLLGRGDHAGTTLLVDRLDPMLDLARFITCVRAAAERHGGLATVGKVRVHPNAVNAVPSAVTAWLDARADGEEQVTAIVAALHAEGFELTRESWTGPTPFAPGLTAHLAHLAGDVPVLPTGAGHDAGVLAQAGIETAMIFARNPTGISHAPEEFATPADCQQAAGALAAAVEDLAG